MWACGSVSLGLRTGYLTPTSGTSLGLLADAAAATCHDGALVAQLQIHEPPLPLPPTMIGSVPA